MTTSWGPGMPPGGPSPIGDEFDPYALWDASYVLGSLSSTERREYEAHLSACTACRSAVAELSGMPALLALLDRDEVAAADEGGLEPPPLRPEVLDSLLAKVNWRRRRSRWLTWSVAAAAAVVLTVGVLIAIRPGPIVPGGTPPPRASATSLTMTPTVPSSLDATVSLTSQGWGTHVEMACTYHEQPGIPGHGNDDTADRLAMVAVGRDGSHTQLATWMALDGVTALPSGSTSMPIDEIVSVQVISADTGDVLLSRSL